MPCGDARCLRHERISCREVKEVDAITSVSSMAQHCRFMPVSVAISSALSIAHRTNPLP